MEVKLREAAESKKVAIMFSPEMKERIDKIAVAFGAPVDGLLFSRWRLGFNSRKTTSPWRVGCHADRNGRQVRSWTLWTWKNASDGCGRSG